jgi:hypothetical protein
MAGKLVQVATNTVTSPVGYIDLIGTTTDDVYMVTANNIVVDTDARQWNLRVLKSSSPDVTSNYDFAYKQLRADTTFGNGAVTNSTFYGATFLGTAGNEDGNFLLYLFNFNSSSEYSFITTEESARGSSGQLIGSTGGVVHTVASASNGIRISCNNGVNNFTSGTFTLYKVL